MIARIWHGHARPKHAGAYEAMLNPGLLPGSAGQKPTRAAIFFGENGEEIEIVTIMLWDSIDASAPSPAGL